MLIWLSVAGLIVSIYSIFKKIKGAIIIGLVWLLTILSILLTIYRLDWIVFGINLISSVLLLYWIWIINKDKKERTGK